MSSTYNRGSVMTLVETTRQRLGFKKGDLFEPTPNVRNPHMMEEAEAFAPQLRAFERAVREYHKHVQGFLGSLIPLLEENLPRVWTAVSGGLAEPVRPAISHGHPSRIGGDFSTTLILERLDILNHGMEQDILAPLRRWQEGLGVAKERMGALERLRRDVDKQRRTAEKKFKRSERKLRRAYLGAGFGSSSSDSSSDFEDRDYIVPRGRLLEDYQRLALHTERHLNAIMESYRDQERLLWEQLSGLVTDAAWLESYAAAAMLKVKETMQAVALAIGPSKQPLPAFRHAVYPFDGQYGQIGHNIDLVKTFGPRARDLASGAVPSGVEVLPYTPLRAKRGVSTPLMVAAAARPGRQQQALAAQPVPPVQVGAHGIPLEAVPERMRESIIRDVEERAMGSGTRVADVPALPPALDMTQPAGVGRLPVTGTSGRATAAAGAPMNPSRGTAGAAFGSTMAPSAGRMSPLTPSPARAATRESGAVRYSSDVSPSRGMAVGGGSRTVTTGSSEGVMQGSPSFTPTTGTTGEGMVSRAAETAGGAVGSVTGAARSAAEYTGEAVAGAASSAAETAGEVVGGVTRAARSAGEAFGEGVAEGEARGNRDVARSANTIEAGRERFGQPAAAASARQYEEAPRAERVSEQSTPALRSHHEATPVHHTAGDRATGGPAAWRPEGNATAASGGALGSSSFTPTTGTTGEGMVSRAAETAGEAVGGAAGVARSAAEYTGEAAASAARSAAEAAGEAVGAATRAAHSAGQAASEAAGSAAHFAGEAFGEGVAEGEARGNRDVARTAETIEAGRQRVADATAGAVSAPSTTERVSGPGHSMAPDHGPYQATPVYPTAGNQSAGGSAAWRPEGGATAAAAVPAGIGAAAGGALGDEDVLDTFAFAAKGPTGNPLSAGGAGGDFMEPYAHGDARGQMSSSPLTPAGGYDSNEAAGPLHGFQHQQEDLRNGPAAAAAAAPAGFSEGEDLLERGYTLDAHDQQQQGIMGAVKRAVGL